MLQIILAAFVGATIGVLVTAWMFARKVVSTIEQIAKNR